MQNKYQEDKEEEEEEKDGGEGEKNRGRIGRGGGGWLKQIKKKMDEKKNEEIKVD